jgi:lipoprotein-releasing system ATP-binding protein
MSDNTIRNSGVRPGVNSAGATVPVIRAVAAQPAASSKKTIANISPASSNPSDADLPATIRLADVRAERALYAPGKGAALTARHIYKTYRKGKLSIPVLRGVDADFRPGEFVAIVGASGSGKSTLLHILGTLDAPDKGEVLLDGQRIDNLPTSRRDLLRNKTVGMIFQFYHLLPELSALENVLSPLMIAESTWGYLTRRRQHRERAASLLEMVGLKDRMHHKPRELSGGEMQRAAIARALVAHPRVLLADEPTGNLDRRTGDEILELLRGLREREQLTIIMVTHDLTIADEADRIIRLAEGRVQSA